MSTLAFPSTQDIQEELEKESIKRPLYNPSNGWLDGRYSAFSIPLCPDAEVMNIRTGRVEATNGVTEIADIWGEEYAKDEESGKLAKTGTRRLYATSLDQVKHLIKTFGPMGLVRLTGDPKKDERIKSDAKKRWVSHRVKWAAEVIANRDGYLREFHAAPSNSGQMPNPPNSIEMEAIEFMAEYRLGTIGRKNFACQHDGYQTDDGKKWATHQRAYHPEDVAREEKGDAKEPDKKGTRGKG
jgi:hypothetical protein